jgi:dipeptidyl aminopeptidase/acylaminoacyl peptidase
MLAYIGDRTDGPIAHDLLWQLTASIAFTNLTSSSLDRPIGSYVWLKDGQLLAVAEDGFENSLYKLSMNGKDKTAVPLKNLRNEFAQLSSGIAYVCGNAAEPDELCFSNASGNAVKVSHFNKDLQALPLVMPEFYRYKSFDGTQIEAALLKPTTAKPGKLPLIVLVHGGPTGRWPDAYEAWGQLLVPRGYAVFYPNVRGSTGYGYHFIEVNRRDWGGGDFKDVMAGVMT